MSLILGQLGVVLSQRHQEACCLLIGHVAEDLVLGAARTVGLGIVNSVVVRSSPVHVRIRGSIVRATTDHQAAGGGVTQTVQPATCTYSLALGHVNGNEAFKATLDRKGLGKQSVRIVGTQRGVAVGVPSRKHEGDGRIRGTAVLEVHRDGLNSSTLGNRHLVQDIVLRRVGGTKGGTGTVGVLGRDHLGRDEITTVLKLLGCALARSTQNHKLTDVGGGAGAADIDQAILRNHDTGLGYLQVVGQSVLQELGCRIVCNEVGVLGVTDETIGLAADRDPLTLQGENLNRVVERHGGSGVVCECCGVNLNGTDLVCTLQINRQNGRSIDRRAIEARNGTVPNLGGITVGDEGQIKGIVVVEEGVAVVDGNGLLLCDVGEALGHGSKNCQSLDLTDSGQHTGSTDVTDTILGDDHTNLGGRDGRIDLVIQIGGLIASGEVCTVVCPASSLLADNDPRLVLYVPNLNGVSKRHDVCRECSTAVGADGDVAQVIGRSQIHSQDGGGLGRGVNRIEVTQPCAVV